MKAQQLDFKIGEDASAWLQQELLAANKGQGSKAASFHRQLTVRLCLQAYTIVILDMHQAALACTPSVHIGVQTR